MILTVIAANLTFQTLSELNIVPQAHADSPNLSPNSVMDVNIKSISTYDDLKVNLVDINTSDQINVKLNAVNTSIEFPVNLEEVNGYNV